MDPTLPPHAVPTYYHNITTPPPSWARPGAVSTTPLSDQYTTLTDTLTHLKLHPNYSEASQALTPHPSTEFFSPMAVVWANIDAGLNFTQLTTDSYTRQSWKQFSYGVWGDPQGSVAEYIQWRLPISVGCGVAPRASAGVLKLKQYLHSGLVEGEAPAAD